MCVCVCVHIDYKWSTRTLILLENYGRVYKVKSFSLALLKGLVEGQDVV